MNIVLGRSHQAPQEEQAQMLSKDNSTDPVESLLPHASTHSSILHLQSTHHVSGPGIGAEDTAGNKPVMALAAPSSWRAPNNRRDGDLIDNHTKQVAPMGEGLPLEKHTVLRCTCWLGRSDI